MISTRNISDTDLLQQLREGDESAFEQIYQKYSASIYENLLKLVKDEQQAQEILQEVFLKIWEKRANLSINQSFQGFLYRVSSNLVIDFYRKVKRDQNLLNNLTVTVSEEYGNLEELYINDEDGKLLQQAIEALSPQRKKIFILCKLEGKSYEEVAQLLNLSTSTISDHIVKATKTIRNQLIISGNLALAFAVSILLR